MVAFLTNNAAELLLLLGLVGTLLEQAGTALNKPGLTKFGQRLEGLGTDLPKAIRGSRAGQ